MSKTYRTGNYGIKIEAFELIRETATTVWFHDASYGQSHKTRSKKDGSYQKFHASWEAARDFLLAKAQRRIESAKSTLQALRSELGQIESLKNPESVAVLELEEKK